MGTGSFPGVKSGQRRLPFCNGQPVPPRDARVKVILNARPLLKSVAQKLCRCKCSQWLRRTRVPSATVLASKWRIVVRDSLSNTWN